MIKPRPFILTSVLAAAIVAASLACHSEAPTPDTHGAPRGRNPRAAAAATDYPVIVRVVGRHDTITVTAGPAGPLYSAATNDGKVIVAASTLEQLRREHPDVYRQLEPGVATEKDQTDAAREAGTRSSGSGRAMQTSTSADVPVMLMSAE